MMDATPERRGSVPLAEPGPNGELYADTYYDLWAATSWPTATAPRRSWSGPRAIPTVPRFSVWR